MKFNTKVFYRNTFLFLSLINILMYGAFHLCYHIGADWLDYFRTFFLSPMWETVFPCLCAVLLLIVYAFLGVKATVGMGAVAVSSRVFYYIPTYYMTYFLSVSAPDSLSSIFLALLSSVVMLLITALHIGVLFFIGAIAYKLMNRKKADFKLVPALRADLSRPTLFDFSSQGAYVILSVCLAQFLYSLSSIIGEIIAFFNKYGMNYRISELVTMIVQLVLSLVFLVASHIIISAIKNRIIKTRLETE